MSTALQGTLEVAIPVTLGLAIGGLMALMHWLGYRTGRALGRYEGHEDVYNDLHLLCDDEATRAVLRRIGFQVEKPK